MNGTLETELDQERVRLPSVSLNVMLSPPVGPPLLLLHGIGSRWTTWWPVIDELASRFRLVMPDWRGHGESAKPGSGYHVTDYSTDLVELIHALEIERPMVAGHSLGGIVTMATLAHHPGLFERVVLEDAPLRTEPGVETRLDEWLRLSEMTIEEAARYYQRHHPEWSAEDCWRRARSITSTHSGVFREAKAWTAQSGPIDWIAPLSGAATPILLVHGDADQGSPVDPLHIERFKAGVPRGRAIEIPGGNHFLHRDHREQFLDVALPFLEGRRV